MKKASLCVMALVLLTLFSGCTISFSNESNSRTTEVTTTSTTNITTAQTTTMVAASSTTTTTTTTTETTTVTTTTSATTSVRPSNTKASAVTTKDDLGDGSKDSGVQFISRDAAKQIALAKAGVTVDEIRDYEIELDYDDDTRRWEYEISFDAGRVEYECEIHAVDGTVLYFNKDFDD